MSKRLTLALAAAAVLSISSLASATPVTITGDPNAPTSNFGTPGNTATYGYTINVSDNGTAVVVELTTDISTPFDFANLYFETDAFDTNMGSNLGFEASGTAVNDAFIPGVNGSNRALTGLGFTSSETYTALTKTITVTLPNSFFLTDPLNMGFPLTPSGGATSLHLSQSFGYSVVGGSDNYPRPAELGLANMPASPVPEPGELSYMALSGFGLLAEAGRRFRARKRA